MDQTRFALSRRRLLQASAAMAAAGIVLPPMRLAQAATPCNFSTVIAEAKALAAQAYEDPDAVLPEDLANLDYDGYRRINHKPESRIWAGVHNYEIATFHLGGAQKRPVTLNTCNDGQADLLPYNAENYRNEALPAPPQLPQDIGFAGFRLHYPLNNPETKDELLVFMGASYFRGLGKGNLYGTSARGIAVDTALPRPEEFPRFTKFWIEEPPHPTAPISILALLNGPSVTGAYRFVVTPGEQTLMEVQARLFTRAAIERLGIAPMTSMFMWGPSDPWPTAEYRPQVHDCDGLAVQTATGERIWRPLRNPNQVRISVFRDTDGAVPQGFGLMQRDRVFNDYQDLEARYDLRPSVWVEPVGDWGPGSVLLIELPTPDETNDNIVAMWNPERPIEAGAELAFDYRLSWGMKMEPTAIATVERVALSVGGVPGMTVEAGQMKLVIDYIVPEGLTIPEDLSTLSLEFNAARARTTEPVVHHNPVSGGLRVFFDFQAEGDMPAEFRLSMKHNGEQIAETVAFQAVAE